MEGNLIEIEKRTLNSYYSRLLRCHPQNKLQQFQFLWRFIHKSILFAPIVEEMRSARERYWNIGNYIVHTPYQPLPEDYLDRIYAVYFAFEIILKSPRSQYALHDLGRKFNPDKDQNNREADFNILNDLLLEEFIFYLINQADRNNITLGLLRKYKQRTEWFNSDTLFEMVKDHSTKAEKLLKKDLHLYLSDQGLDITIEPVSPGGEADFIGIETSGLSKSVIEVKIFDGRNRDISKTISGYHQILTYMRDHDASKGYLVIYNSAAESLNVNANSGISFPYVISENRTIYFVIVNIYHHPNPASKRGNMGTIEINESEFK